MLSLVTALQITLEAMKSSIDDVALQGIEFWSTVCDEEVDLAIEAAEAEDSGHPPAQTSRFYVKGAMEYLVPHSATNTNKTGTPTRHVGVVRVV